MKKKNRIRFLNFQHIVRCILTSIILLLNINEDEHFKIHIFGFNPEDLKRVMQEKGSRCNL